MLDWIPINGRIAICIDFILMESLFVAFLYLPPFMNPVFISLEKCGVKYKNYDCSFFPNQLLKCIVHVFKSVILQSVHHHRPTQAETEFYMIKTPS